MTNTSIEKNVSLKKRELTLIERLKLLFSQRDDSSKFDEILNNRYDILLFDKTISELRRSNEHSKKITLSNGREITISLK